MNEDMEQIELLRKHNRALRKINSLLRKALQESREYSDNLFLELCNTTSEKQETFENDIHGLEDYIHNRTS